MKRYLIPLGFALIWMLISLLALGFSALVYTGLTAEAPTASLYFEKVGDKEYEGFIAEQEGVKLKDFDKFMIFGDQ